MKKSWFILGGCGKISPHLGEDFNHLGEDFDHLGKQREKAALLSTM